MVGDFSYAGDTFTYGPNDTTIDHIGISNLQADGISTSPWTDILKWYQPDSSHWSIYPSGADQGKPTMTSILNYATQSWELAVGGAGPCADWSYVAAHRLNKPKLVMGCQLKFSYKLVYGDYFGNYPSNGGNAYVFIRYYDASNNILYNETLEQFTVPDVVNMGESVTHDSTGANAITRVFPYIENVSYITINFVFEGGAQLSSFWPLDMAITSFQIFGYNKHFTRINGDGIDIYNSPVNYVRLTTEGAELKVANVKAGGLDLTRNHGKLPAAPTANVKIGDVYISNTNAVYMATAVNGITGIINWTQLG
jgi:hypothetical protein